MKKRIISFISGKLNKFTIFFILLILVLTLSIITPYFLTTINLINVIRQISFSALIAFGMTFVIISGGIDLSPGSVLALVSVIVASFAHPGEYPLIVPIAIGIGVGLITGLINGTLVSFAKMPPIIATLGMLAIARGAALAITNGRAVSDVRPEIITIGAGSILNIPNPIIILAIIGILVHLLLTKTKLGRYIFAVGGNERVAITSGINVKFVKIFVYVLIGVLTAISAIVLTGRIYSGQPGIGEGYELDAIAAAVIGGTSLTGGVGTILGTFLGALVIGVINNGMDLLHINVYYQMIAKGVIIITAVLMDSLSSKKLLK